MGVAAHWAVVQDVEAKQQRQGGGSQSLRFMIHGPHPKDEDLPSFTTEGNGLQAWKAREEGRGVSGMTGNVKRELW